MPCRESAIGDRQRYGQALRRHLERINARLRGSGVERRSFPPLGSPSGRDQPWQQQVTHERRTQQRRPRADRNRDPVHAEPHQRSDGDDDREHLEPVRHRDPHVGEDAVIRHAMQPTDELGGFERVPPRECHGHRAQHRREVPSRERYQHNPLLLTPEAADGRV